MATAIGVYATIAGVKARLGITNGTDDALLQSLCDQWNGWVESKTGRIFAPIPAFASTVVSGGGAGSTAVTLATAAGLAPGDALMLGPVTGTHEHQTVAAAPVGAIVTLQAPLISGYAGGVVARRVQILSGEGTEDGRALTVDTGIIAIRSLEVSPTENAISAGWYLVPPTDYYLWPPPLQRDSPGDPSFELRMTAIPSAGNAFPFFAQYRLNVRIDADMGWPVAPDELVGVALRLVVADYRRRGSGGGNQVTVGSDGSRVIEQALSATDWHTINRYVEKVVDII